MVRAFSEDRIPNKSRLVVPLTASVHPARGEKEHFLTSFMAVAANVSDSCVLVYIIVTYKALNL